MERYCRKLRIFCELGRQLAKLSTCKRAQNGAVVFPIDCSAVFAIGYNGPAMGLPNDRCTASEGSCGCAHAEANAITKLYTREPAIIFTTCTPCVACANAIINCGSIIGLLYDKEYRDLSGTNLLLAAGISVVHTDYLTGDRICDQVRQWRNSYRKPLRASLPARFDGIPRL